MKKYYKITIPNDVYVEASFVCSQCLAIAVLDNFDLTIGKKRFANEEINICFKMAEGEAKVDVVLTIGNWEKIFKAFVTRRGKFTGNPQVKEIATDLLKEFVMAGCDEFADLYLKWLNKQSSKDLDEYFNGCYNNCKYSVEGAPCPGEANGGKYLCIGCPYKG